MSKFQECWSEEYFEDAKKVELNSPITVKEGRMTDGPWDPQSEVAGRDLMICLQGRWVGFPARYDAYKWLSEIFRHLAGILLLEDPSCVSRLTRIDYSIERMFERRYELLVKGTEHEPLDRATEDEKAELASINSVLGLLPSHTNPDDIEAMRIIHEAAAEIRNRKGASKIQAEDMFSHPNFKMPDPPDVTNNLEAQQVAEWAAWAVATFISPTKVDGEHKEIECGDLADTIRTRVAERLKAEIRGGKGG